MLDDLIGQDYHDRPKPESTDTGGGKEEGLGPFDLAELKQAHLCLNHCLHWATLVR
jgi:hypothetical protein